MQIKYDKDTDILTIKFSDKKPVESEHLIKQEIVVDCDENGNIIGLEIFDWSERRDKDDIKFDEEAKVLYVKLMDEEIEHTKEPFPDIVLDYSQTDKPVGVEILNIKIDPDKV